MILTKATFQELKPKTGKVIEVQFNPTQLSLGRTLQIGIPEGKRTVGNMPQVTSSTEDNLSLELVFDTTDKGLKSPQDVRKQESYKLLRALVDIKQLLQGKSERAAPLVRFQWGEGKLEYCGFVKSFQERFTMFAPNGTPVRANVTVTMEAYESPEQRAKASGRQSKSTSRWVVQSGQTLSGIAGDVYGDPAKWRRIAVQNMLTDPMALAPGQILTIPMAD